VPWDKLSSGHKSVSVHFGRWESQPLFELRRRDLAAAIARAPDSGLNSLSEAWARPGQ
jgi:hypothetical protein